MSESFVKEEPRTNFTESISDYIIANSKEIVNIKNELFESKVETKIEEEFILIQDIEIKVKD